VTERVIDVFESVKIHEHNGKRMTVTMSPLDPVVVDVACNMLIYQTRLERTELALVGRREDRLRRGTGSWLISRRKIVLDQTLIPRTISIFL
jgi:3-phenylpropionate/cinnamic acid dioxygenase small subunit